jgi:hypothetical protein
MVRRQKAEGRMLALFADEAALPVMDMAARDLLLQGLGGAFALAFLVVVLLRFSGIDQGFLGLILLLVLVIFALCFTIMVAALTPGVAIKIVVGVVDALAAIAARLLSPRFLDYLESEPGDNKRKRA